MFMDCSWVLGSWDLVSKAISTFIGRTLRVGVFFVGSRLRVPLKGCIKGTVRVVL